MEPLPEGRMATNRKPYHPPEPGVWHAPEGETPGYIVGDKGVAGVGEQGLYVAAIPAALARELVIKHHYSHRVVNNSYCHLGVFYKRNLAGVMQWGYALCPARAGKVVEGTKQGEYLELNRMWLADVCPRNTESRTISFAVKYIRRAMPSVAWLQSFADERCGGLGVVYQAASFLYVGSHLTEFFFLDCDTYHGMLLTAHRKSGQRGERLRQDRERAIPLRCRQFRYVRFLKQSWRKRLRLPVLPYPKRQGEGVPQGA